MFSRILVSFAMLVGLFGAAAGQQGALPPGNQKPFPRPQADGPSSFVTASALSPDGKTLYVAGWDKVVHVWRLDESGQFVLDRAATYRVPIGPGQGGSLNALALSSDGVWLAVAGYGLARGEMSFESYGVTLHRVPTDVLQDRGLIYVFNTKTRAVKLLRGTAGRVFSLAFAPSAGAEQSPVLVSAAQEWDDNRESEVGSLRVWDLDKGANLATLPNLPTSAVRPGLAVWRSAQGLRVAVAWDDGMLRMWNVEKGAQGLSSVKDAKSNNSAAYLADHAVVLTTSFSEEKGWLQGWNVPAAGTLQANKALLAAFPKLTNGNTSAFFFPRAMTLFAGKAGGALDHAAVILRRKMEEIEDDRLQIVRIDKNGKLLPLLTNPILVASGGGTQPVVTASAGGRHLVVAGNRTHEVLVFAIDDLLKNQAQAGRQSLRSVGETIRYASFVKKGNDRGLVVNPLPKETVGGPARAAAKGDLIFDLSNRKLLGNPAGWQLDAPAAGNWQVAVNGKQVTVSKGDMVVRQIPLKERQVVTDYALLPGAQPLLALATHELGLPSLAIYNVQTGQPIQQLIGHTERIRGLALSGDGKLLVSAAEDQTVCVWGLADVSKVLGKIGTISGLKLRDGDNKNVVVLGVEEGSPAAGKLKEGDTILGIVEDGKLKPIESERDFFIALWQITPGTMVTLRLKRGDVTLPVDQGLQARNPLFSLFITRGATAAERDWLGWSPTGPYDASRAEVERHLGWHINTGDAAAPTRFAEAGQYKKEYHRPDLLKYLAAKGNLDQALEEWEREYKAKKQGKKLPEPQINVRIAEAGPEPLRKDGEVVVRESPRTLRLAIDNFAADDVGQVTWSVPGLAAEPRAFAASEGREYTADLSKLAWQRGAWKVRIELQTQEDTPRKYTQDLALRYQPPAPEVTAPTGHLVVDKPDFAFKAAVQPGAPGQMVQVNLIHRHQGQEVSTEALAGKIDKTLKLRPGDNHIEVVAVNKGVPAEYQELETTRRVLEVTYQPPVPDPQPIITLETVAPLGSRVSPAVAIVPGRPVVVDAAKVLVRGKISASKDLSRAEWARGKDAAKPLARFAADQAKEFTISEELTLVPGTHQFRFLAKTAKSEPAETTLSVTFRPPLPQLVLTFPQTGLILYEGKDPATVDVRYQVLNYQADYPFEASFVVNDKLEGGIKPALDGQTRTLSAKVPLGFGDNRIQVRLKNKWDMEETVDDTVLVRYLRPPRITKLDGPAESDKSLVDLTATVESPLPLLPGSVDAEVSNMATGTRRRITTINVSKAGNTWTVQLNDVPLEVGDNEVRLSVGNSDARALEPATRTVVFKKTPPPPALVELLDPRENVSVTERELTMRFRVTSKSALRRLELVQQGAAQFRQAIDVAKLKAAPDGSYEVKLALKLAGAPAGKVASIDPSTLTANAQGFLEGAAAIGLVNGTNALRVEAVNEGGQTDAGVVVSVLREPVRLVIDRIEPRGGKGTTLLPRSQGEGRIAFPEAEHGRVVLHGRVKWPGDKDAELKQINQVQVFVNGLRQPPVTLEAATEGKRERTFQAPLSLTGKDNNQIEVVLPGLAVEESDRQKFTVACKSPEAQRLHLLIVGVGEDDEAKLVRQVLDGLHVKPSETDLQQRRFKAPNFAEGRIYPPLVGYVRPGQVLTELRRIKDEIDLLSRGGATSDVVMVYFTGQKAQQGDVNYCLTSVSQHVPDLRRSALAFNSLEACLAETLGAQVMLLNVNQAPNHNVGAGGAGNYLSTSRVGLVCYEWESLRTDAKQLPQAMHAAIKGSATLGAVAEELSAIARSQGTLCFENLSKGHQLTSLRIGSAP